MNPLSWGHNKILLAISGLILVIGVVSASQPPSPNLQSEKQNGSPETSAEESAGEAVVVTVTKEEEIPFEQLTLQDSTLEKGKTLVKLEGQAGKKLITYRVTTYSDGTQTREKQGEQIIAQPVSKITLVGTKVIVTQPKPSGSGYTNVDGNWVPSPTYSDTVPSGASAKCRDGTYSFSQNRRGTCSHHGGVAQWLR